MTAAPSRAPTPHPIDRLPESWRPALLPINRNKRPCDPCTGELLNGWSKLPPGFFPDDVLQAAPAIGLRLGPASDGIEALDFDGREADSTFLEIFKRPSSDLPRTVGWTSGKDGRRQLAYRVPPEYWPAMADRKAKVGALEFRWDGQQSVICGAHPETEGYRWLEGCAPWEVEVAMAPDWLLEGMPRKAAAPAAHRNTIKPAPALGGDAVPFREFLSRKAAELIEAGSAEGSCNDDGLMLSQELVAVEAWLAQQGVRADETAQEAYAAYLSHCPDRINGQPFDVRAAWRRFEGAEAMDVHPATPEAKLLQRLDYHRRRASRPAANNVLQLPPRPQQQDTGTPEARQAVPQVLTAEQVRQRLAEAIEEGIGKTDLAQLVAELASASEKPLQAVRLIAESLTRDAEQAAAVTAEAEQLQATAGRQQVAAALSTAALLPARLAAALDAVTTTLPCDGPATVLPFLTAVAGLVKLGTTVEVIPAAGFRVPLNMFTCLVGHSGQKKTPTGKRLVTEPVSELRAELALQNAQAHDQWRDQCKGIKDKNDRPPMPHPLRLQTNDFTGEALTAQLQAQEVARLGLLIHRDELAALFSSLNAYRGGKGGDEQQLLELYDGGGMTSLRVSGDRYYGKSQVSIYGGTQPDVLRKLVAEGDASGLWARFMFVPLPATTHQLPTFRDPKQERMAQEGEQYLRACCWAIHHLPPQQYYLTPAAMQRFSDYEYSRQQAVRVATIEAHRALYGKSAGKVARVAGLLHLLRIAVGEIDQQAEIDVAQVNHAIALVDHLDSWALGLHTEVASGGVGSLMRNVHRIAEAAGEPVGWKQIRAGLSKPQRAEADAAAGAEAMRALEAGGYGVTQQGPRGGLTYRALRPLP